MTSELRGLGEDDRALLERVAARIVELRLEVPATLALETAAPVSLLAGQALIFLEPLLVGLLRLRDYRRFAAMVERRETLEALTGMIEARAGDASAERRAGARRRRPASGPATDAHG